MANLILNGKTYDIDKLSKDAKAHVDSLQFVDAELARLNASVAVLQTAKNAYINALKPHLDALGETPVQLQ